MTGRYYITGVQLGVLIAIARKEQNIQIEKILQEIEKNQFMGYGICEKMKENLDEETESIINSAKEKGLIIAVDTRGKAVGTTKGLKPLDLTVCVLIAEEEVKLIRQSLLEKYTGKVIKG